MERDPSIEQFLDSFLERMTGRKRKAGECTLCGAAVMAGELRDDISRREFAISGTCQSCQDEVFGGP